MTARRPQVTPSPSGRLRVLVVDDSRVIQRLAAAVLEQAGHDVRVAGSGLDALRLLSARRYDVVLMDVQMPRLDGPTATAVLREQGLQTPIIALTASSKSEEWARCQNAGMDGYLAKPFVPQELVGTVEGWGRRPGEGGVE